MASVGAAEANTHLSRLLDRVERGERITICRHGRPVAALVPAGSSGHAAARTAVAELRRLRRDNRLDGLSLRDMIEEGRR